MSIINNFETMLENGNDSSLLRYSLGNEYYKLKEYTKAIEHLDKAIEQQQDYSAAWKLYAKVLAESGKTEEAVKAYAQGISVAEKNGDKQAVKEMTVFLKRLKK